MNAPMITRDALAPLPRDEAVARLRAAAGSLSLAERFRLLHELGIYHGDESLSGDGSSHAETAALRGALPSLLRRYQVRSLLDVPCGDFHWLQRVNLDEVDYTGADIVRELVVANTERYGGAGHTFRVLDVTRDSLPAVDLVLCRDLLIHLSNTHVVGLLDNIARSGARLLLASHYTDCETNGDIPSGDFRPINLCRPPFNLPVPVEVIDERSTMAGGAHSDRAMALWCIEDLRGARGNI